MGGFARAATSAGIGQAAKVLSKGEPHPLDLFPKVLHVNLADTSNVARLAPKALSEVESDLDGEPGVIVNTASAAAFDVQIGRGYMMEYPSPGCRPLTA